MPKIGYARANSSSHDRDIQKAELAAVGCEVIRSETVSGASRDDRSELGTVILYSAVGSRQDLSKLLMLAR